MTIRWLMPDEDTSAANSVLERVVLEGALVPSLWRLEVANVLQIAVRRQRCSQLHADESIRDLARLPITVDAETDARAWVDTLALAKTEGITTYDAAYLELALRRSVPLASCDAQLLAACSRHGLNTYSA